MLSKYHIPRKKKRTLRDIQFARFKRQKITHKSLFGMLVCNTNEYNRGFEGNHYMCMFLRKKKHRGRYSNLKILKLETTKKKLI